MPIKLTFTTAVILLLCCSYSWRTGDGRPLSCQNRLLSRLDFLNCSPHPNTSWPGPNEYALYRTRIRSKILPPDCKYQDPNVNDFQIIRPIDNLDNPNVRLLYSPGYLLNRRYANNLLVNYSVQCPQGRLPFLVYNDFHLQNRECHDRCEDYVDISCADCGSSESCGTEPTDSFYSLEQERFSVIFRTSQRINDVGFELSVICFDPNDMNKTGNSNSGGVKKRDLEIHAFILSANEEDVCKNLTCELFNVIPSSHDLDIADITEGDLTELEAEDLPLLNRRRSAAVSPFPHHLVSTSAIRLALLHENSSNPVVSTVATSVLSIATQQSPSRVESVRKSLS